MYSSHKDSNHSGVTEWRPKGQWKYTKVKHVLFVEHLVRLVFNGFTTSLSSIAEFTHRQIQYLYFTDPSLFFILLLRSYTSYKLDSVLPVSPTKALSCSTDPKENKNKIHIRDLNSIWVIELEDSGCKAYLTVWSWILVIHVQTNTPYFRCWNKEMKPAASHEQR